jgi:hypothetical protein
MPLIGIIGITKNKVINRIPFFSRNGATVLHCPQRIGAVACEPHEKNFVPMIKNIVKLLALNILSLE